MSDTVFKMNTNAQVKVETIPKLFRLSNANAGGTYPEKCLGGADHQWTRIRDPFGPPYQSGLHEDKCRVCGWVHGWDDGD